MRSLARGRASARAFIPEIAFLIGLRVRIQALVFDPDAGNPLGAVLSDAAVAVIGAGDRTSQFRRTDASARRTSS